MKTKQSYMFFVILLFIISVTMNAQIKHKIEQVAGKEVKTKIWKGREIQFVRREIAVKIIPSATQTEINKLLETVGGRIINSFDKLGWGLIELPFDKDEILAVDDLLKLPFVTAAEPNMVTSVFLEPNDPYFQGTSPATYPYQWALKNTGQTPPTGTNDADIDAPEAWNISTGNSDVIIAILDTGIPMLNGSLSHPDLDDPNKIILGSDYIDVPGTPEYQEGVRDRFGHGTHVAGIAAAESNNGTGIAGVAWNCKVLVVQVFDAYGSGTWPSFYNGVIYAVDYQRNNPSKKVVINFSGGGGSSQQALDAVIYANTYSVPIVASAGNNGGTVSYPAAYSSSYSNVIAVSATDQNDIISSYSNFGSQINVATPGGWGVIQDGYVLRFNTTGNLGRNIFSTTPNYVFNIQTDPEYAGDPYSTDVTQSYGYMAGTSMAAPHVSGTAALLLSVNPNLTPSQIRNILQQTADDKGEIGFDNYYGYGRINAHRALAIPKIAYFSQDPDPLYNGGTGYVYAHLSQGLNVTYSWYASSTPSNITLTITPDGNRCQVHYYTPFNTLPTINITCVASNSVGTDVKSYQLNVKLYSYSSSASLAFEKNGEIIDENPILVSSVDNPGVDITDYYLINEKIVPESNTIKFLIHETDQIKGHTDLDQVELWEVKANKNEFIAVTEEGEVISYKKLASPNKIILNDSLDITDVLADKDKLKLAVKKGDRLKIKQTGSTAYSGEELYSIIYAQLYNAEDLSADNNISGKYYFRPQPSAVCKKIKVLPSGGIEIEFTDDLLIDYFALVKNEKTAKVEKLKLLEALNKEKVNVRELLTGIDASYNKISPGEEINFTFDSKNNSDEDVSYILKSVGRYEENNPSMNKIGSGIGVANIETKPEKTELIGNYPNPFNPTTNISYNLKENIFVELTIINSLGQEVKKLVSENQAIGYYSIPFDGSKLASGVYFYRLQVGNQVFTRKMMIMK